MRKKRIAEKWAYKATNGSTLYSKFLRILFSLDLPCTVKIGKNLRLMHNGLAVVIHKDAIIGDNVCIYPNVTLGGNGVVNAQGIVRRGGPKIENNVAIFSGARVLGPITIGHDSYIGANAVVTKDVPPNHLAIGNPAIIKPRTFTYHHE